jgi:hypothetical protein
VSVLAAFINAILLVAIVCPIAWFILSRWLDGKSLIVAAVASAVSLGIGRSSYSGPPDLAALVALASLAGTLFGGVVIAKIWLARAAKNNGLADG